MPPRYYAVRETDSLSDVTLHDDRDCPDGPTRAAPPTVAGDYCSECCGDGDPETDPEETDSVADLVDAGVCPWCDEYEGDYLGQHASSAHPDEWDAHREG